MNIKARVPVDVAAAAAAFVYCMALSGLELFCVCYYCCSAAIGHAYPAIAYMNLLFTKVLVCDIRLCTSQLHEGQKPIYKCGDKIHQLAVSDGEERNRLEQLTCSGGSETEWIANNRREVNQSINVKPPLRGCTNTS